MGQQVARIGDRTTGTCFCHVVPIGVGGTIVSGSPNVNANARPVARFGDTIVADCGHTATIITSSAVDYANSLGIARVGDQGTGCYVCTIITGSPNVYSG